MAVVLNTDDLLAALAACPAIGEAETVRLHMAVENAVTAIAGALAKSEGVTLSDVSYHPGFGGLCASFVEGATGDRSELLASYDTGGGWD